MTIMRTEETGLSYTITFDSLDEMIDTAERHWGKCPTVREGARDLEWLGLPESGTPRDALTLAREGWTAELPDALALAEHAVRTANDTAELPTFTPFHDVTGCEVDIARFLSDEPECMVDYLTVPIVRAGKVITLCASTSFSSAISSDAILRRGHGVVALALALGTMGYSVEIWADWTTASDRQSLTLRTLLKGATDVLDPERLMYALAHPSMTRCIAFPAAHEAPSSFRHACHIGNGYGKPADPPETLPEGTIYLPCLLSETNVPDADAQLMRYLRELDLIAE